MRKIWNWLIGEEKHRLRIYMKSGNSFVLDGIADYEVSSNGPEVVKLRLNQDVGGKYTTLLTVATSLSQIEAIVRLPRRGA